ncbi:MAG: winged helix-turn-helix transcriptional regulator [Planctomycetota bacterium]|jgi:DNA-binding HxlR family transcriptional regulator
MKRKKAQRLAVLFHHRWAVPILAELHGAGGCKFVTLVNRLGVSRDSLSNTLPALTEAGWVMRNPGYGHPLRPEYILTRSGARLGPWCSRVRKALRRLGIERIGLRKWSLPIAYALTLGKTRFSQLRAIWPDLTPRSLTLALKDLQGAGVVDRLVADGYPPATYYTLTAKGKRLATSLDN